MAEEFKKNQQEVKNEIRKGRNADKVKLREL